MPEKLIAPIICCLLFFTNSLIGQKPQNVVSGKVERIENFPSRWIEPRHIDIWLPENYDGKKKFSVLYMHDGQMLFDSTGTWNRTSWEVDDTFEKLIRNGTIKNTIVVGIWNIPNQRFANYFPEKIIKEIPEPTRTVILEKQLKGKPSADAYLKFIVAELKPYIDSHYATKKNRNNTFLMGSSMGGLISIYGLCEYPDVFGGAACLSIHSPLAAYELINEHTDAEVASKFRSYLQQHLPKANSCRIYFDYGNQTGDAFYRPYQNKIDAIMKEKGWNKKHWKTLFFEGESHTESSWAKRLATPTVFLLGK